MNHQGTESISNISVKDSGCRDASTAITAGSGSVDLGNNGSCWAFAFTLTQNGFRIYANTNSLTPTDPWPAGGSDLAENEALLTGQLLGDLDILRLRMNVTVGAATMQASTQAFKLQYVQADTCSAATGW